MNKYLEKISSKQRAVTKIRLSKSHQDNSKDILKEVAENTLKKTWKDRKKKK